MNRETELHFSGIPSVHKPRSKMVIPHDLLTSWDAAQCIPIYCDPDILPGDSVKMKMASVIRMSTPLYPIFGNIVADIMFFFVPYRLVWTHWKEFWGENTNAWYQTQEYAVPQIYAAESNPGGIVQPKTLGDYMGMPVGIPNIRMSALPFRAYCKIWNDWFRSESLQQEVPFETDDTDRQYVYSTTSKGGTILNSNKLMDYFTGCLPSPQKGPDVTLPLGSWAPVYPRDEVVDTIPGLTKKTLLWGSQLGTHPFSEDTYHNILGKATGTPSQTGYYGDLKTHAAVADLEYETSPGPTLYPKNLWTDLSNATAATINNIRMAFQIQKFYEAQSNGSRYIEFIRNIFGVTSPDARLQRSEYLGGKRIPINIQTVLKTGSTDETAPLGMTGAYSHTADADEYFTHSFTEHGVLIGILTTRYYHSFNQGIPRGWSRRKWTDFYVPQFATLGNQAVLNKELYAQGTSADDEVFGYQEAWAGGYRYHPNMVTGAMRTTYAQTLDAWHLADHYESKPTLGSSWIQEDKNNIDRTLAVSSDVENQFFGDFYFRPVYTRVMPLYSVPGLLDHF